jgi:hypothetical protein
VSQTNKELQELLLVTTYTWITVLTRTSRLFTMAEETLMHLAIMLLDYSQDVLIDSMLLQLTLLVIVQQAISLQCLLVISQDTLQLHNLMDSKQQHQFLFNGMLL